jgi:hypothetical protein
MAKSSTSFEKGNLAGAATRFAPGQSGNAGGRPRRTPFADAYRKLADLAVSQLQITHQDTTAEATVKSIYRQAIKEGSVRAAREIADRVDGRVPLPLSTPEGGEFVLNLISHIPRPDRSKKENK